MDVRFSLVKDTPASIKKMDKLENVYRRKRTGYAIVPSGDKAGAGRRGGLWSDFIDEDVVRMAINSCCARSQAGRAAIGGGATAASHQPIQKKQTDDILESVKAKDSGLVLICLKRTVRVHPSQRDPGTDCRAGEENLDGGFPELQDGRLLHLQAL